jgi:hypothetical protein
MIIIKAHNCIYELLENIISLARLNNPKNSKQSGMVTYDNISGLRRSLEADPKIY